MMHMWFWSGTDLGSFLFPGYNVITIGAFIATCLGLIALAIVYEAMKTLQLKLHRKTKVLLTKMSSDNVESSSLLYQLVPNLPNFSCTNWREIYHWILEVVHYSAHTTLGYFFMLAVMTYNVYIFIAIVAGSAIGYWVFSPTLLSSNMTELRNKFNRIPCEPMCADTSIVSTERRQSAVSIVAEQLVSEISAEIHVVSDA